LHGKGFYITVVLICQKESFHSQELDTMVLSEYIFRLCSRHPFYALYLFFIWFLCEPPDWPSNESSYDQCFKILWL